MSRQRYRTLAFLLIPALAACSRSRSGPSPAEERVLALTSFEGGFVGATALLSEFAVYSTARTDLRDSSLIRGAGAGSNAYVEIGCDAVLHGPLVSGGTAFLRERAQIQGDLVVHSTVQRQNGVFVGGATREGAPLTPVAMAVGTVVPGSLDVTIPNGGSQHLAPGAYRDIVVNAGATLTVDSGEYQIRVLQFEPDTRLEVSASDMAPTQLAIADGFRFGDRSRMTGVGSTTPLSLQITSSQSTELYIGTDTQLFGVITAPSASVQIASRANFNGAVYGGSVTVQPQASVCRPPSLLGLAHSEGAYAPAFDPAVRHYNAFVPAGTTELTVDAPTVPGVVATINGAAPNAPIALNETTTALEIVVTNMECGSARYELLVTRSADYVIHVDDSSPAESAVQDGRSWQTAFSSLQSALAAAAVQGKEIHVASGLYKPTARTVATDPRSVSFRVEPGIEIVGGFRGTEALGAGPEGTPFDVVLSGDLSGNDPLTGWPELSEANRQLLSDNARHVVTVRGNSALVGPTLRALTIRGGAADAPREGYGGGLLINYAPPTLENCIVENNYALSGGAGLYAEGGPTRISECLFKENYALDGHGAAMQIRDAKSVEVDGVVFQGNAAGGIGEGAALFGSQSSLHLVNSLLVHNKATGSTAAVVALGGSLSLVNCTVADNSTPDGYSNAVRVASGATLTASNSIFWNSELASEIWGGCTVDHSIVRTGTAGEGNLIDPPSFLDSNQPAGADGLYGTRDDGYRLVKESPGIDVGNDAVAPSVDIAQISRPWGAHADMGAYEYEEYSEQPDVFGRLVGGVFVPTPQVPVIDYIYHGKYITLLAASADSRVIRIAVSKNKRTRNRSTGYLELQGLDTSGTPLAGSVPVRITMYQVADDGTNLYFQSLTPTQGKPILFVDSHWFQNINHPNAYVVYAQAGAPIQVNVPLPQ
jgi:hypothetical protein